jgi:hypothetical protein
MVSNNWKNTSKVNSNFPRAIRDSQNRAVSGGASKLMDSSGAPNLKRTQRTRNRNAVMGFISLVILYAVLLLLGSHVLESAGIVSWSMGVWDSLALVSLYILWQALSMFVWGEPKKP